jgi:hypothetical protein
MQVNTFDGLVTRTISARHQKLKPKCDVYLLPGRRSRRIVRTVPENRGLPSALSRSGSLGCLRHLLKLPARRGETGPEPPHPRRAISSPSHTLQRRSASGLEICCLRTKAISRRWQSETYPRTWGSFLKQCHSHLVLRQYSFSVCPFGVSSIGTKVYTAHNERLDTGRSRTTSRWATNCTLPSLLAVAMCLQRPRGQRTSGTQ